MVSQLLHLPDSEHGQNVVAIGPTSKPLAVDICSVVSISNRCDLVTAVLYQLTQWNSQDGSDNLNGTESVEDGLCSAPVLGEPVESLECETEAEEVLENYHAREAFNGQVT